MNATAQMNRLMYVILSVMERHQERMNSAHIARELAVQGVQVPERTVRYYLGMMDERGYIVTEGRKGRMITEQGRQELSHSRARQRVGFVSQKIQNLSFLTDLNPETGRGRVILNVTHVPEEKLQRALSIIGVVLKSRYAVSNRMLVAQSRDRIGHLTVPAGQVGIGTVCSITLNGILLKAGIPVSSRFGGVVEIQDDTPTRFLSMISYEGSSVAPLEAFIKSGMTDVLGVIAYGSGKILGSFREIPEISLPDGRRLAAAIERHGFGGIVLFGQPGEPLLGVPVTSGKAGVVVLGGLNPVAALEEAEIPTKSQALATMAEYAQLSPADLFATSRLVQTVPEKLRLFGRLHEERRARGTNYWSLFDELKQTTL